ncbi:uncharacterized protein LOC134280201 [Saccostrea cucullata]|uniref:uncharacterized protein LOC134280201 n=1 Tax=Saccostrea cuccullata TaxID=36930 RepID=UPI002ED322FF
MIFSFGFQISILYTIALTVSVAVESFSDFSNVPLYPTAWDIDEAEELTLWIDDNNTRTMLSFYLLLCPEQDMCLGKNFKRNFTFTGQPSCVPCECDDDCVRRATCCPSKFYRQDITPDFIEYMPVVEEVQRGPPMSCIEPLWNIESKIASGTAYWIIQTCQSGANCLSSQSSNISYATPVTSLLTNETYLNFQCALCNYEVIPDLVLWESVKICENRSALFSKHTLETLYLSVFLMSNPVCNIGFRPPKSIQKKVLPCLKYTVRVDPICKFLPEEFQRHIKAACQDYYLPYTSIDKTYKNIYCALCEEAFFGLTIQNIGDGSIFVIDSMLPTFTALIDFNREESMEPKKDSNCATNQIYDSKMSKCLDIKCEADYLYRNSTCLPRYPMIGENNYELNLMVTRQEDFKIMNGFLNEVHLAIFDVLFNNNLLQYLCKVSILASDKTDLIAVVLELSVGHFHDVDLMIKRLINVFSIQEMAIYSELLMRQVHVNISVVGQRFHVHSNSLFGIAIINRLYVNPMDGEQMYLLTDTAVSDGYDYDPNRPLCFEKDMAVVVTDWYRCPKVKVRTRDAKIDVSNFSVCLVDYQACFSSNQFKEPKGKRSVEICVDQYLKTMSQTSSRWDFSEDRVMKYFSIFCLSLSSIASLVTIFSFLLNKSHRSIADINIITLAVLSVLANTVYTFSKFFLWNESLCVGIGMLVHFLWLSVVCWMSLSTFQIFQSFTTFSYIHKKDRKTVLLFLLLDAVLCLAIIAVNVIVTFMRSDGESLGYSPRTCYIADPNMTLFTFALPVGLLVCINCFMFLVTLSRICGKADIRKSKDKSKLSAYFRLSTIVGVAWVFGFLAQFTEFQLFSILHTLFNGGHGIFLYLAFGLPLNLKSLSCKHAKGEKETEMSKNKSL